MPKCTSTQAVKENKQTLLSCVGAFVGNKSFLEVVPQTTCYDEARSTNARGKELLTSLARRASRAKYQCARPAADLGLAGAAAERFTGYCNQAATVILPLGLYIQRRSLF